LHVGNCLIEYEQAGESWKSARDPKYSGFSFGKVKGKMKGMIIGKLLQKNLLNPMMPKRKCLRKKNLKWSQNLRK